MTLEQEDLLALKVALGLKAQEDLLALKVILEREELLGLKATLG